MRIEAGAWVLDLLPALGGAIGRLTWRDRDILRPTPADAADPLASACFPMLPYANRIADGRFGFDGVDYVIPRNAADQMHPLHGVGWLSAWDTVTATPYSATIEHRHAADAAWPWDYAAEQVFMLSDNGLLVRLTITNRSARAMPMTLGFHPYFNCQGVDGFRFDADGVWLTDATILPTMCAPADALGDWAAGESVTRGSAAIDNSYTGWTGDATIIREDGDVRLYGVGTPILHLYTPPASGYFCAEPATDMPDAFNRAAPITLKPDAHHRIVMAITADSRHDARTSAG